MVYQNFGNGPYRSIFDNQEDAANDLNKSAGSAIEMLESNTARTGKQATSQFISDIDYAKTEVGAESN